MRARVRHAWLQKHATPSSAGGDFHWHPAGADGELRAEIAERARGCAAWARLAPGRVVWARGFEEIAPADRRRYAGLAVSVLEAPDVSATALLAAVPALAAAPFVGDTDVEAWVEIAEPVAMSSDCIDAFDAAEAGAAAAALRTGEPLACVRVDATTPRALASLDTWLDAAPRARSRDLAIRVGAPAPAAALDHYAGQAWRAAADDPASARRVWRAALALAVHDGVAPAALFDELAALAAAWDRAGDLDAWLESRGVIDAGARAAAAARGIALAGDDAGWLWSRVVHAWGRGCFDERTGDRLAGALARRILADHLIALERAAQPMRYWRRLRWETMLPHDRRAPLEDAVRARIPSLLEESPVAERRARVPAPPPPGEDADALAEWNDRLGRFLRQADELLDDWARFGAGVRVRLEEQLREVEAQFARGADAAAAKAAASMQAVLDDAAAARVDRVLGERVASLRAELERLERIARGVAGAQSQPRAADPIAQRIWIAVVAANVLLVALIAIVWLRGPSQAPPPVVTQPAIAVPVPDASPPPDAAPADAAPPPDASLPPDAAPAPAPGRGAIRRAAAPHVVAPHP